MSSGPIKCTILPLSEGRLLLPDATIADVIDAKDLQIVVDSQDGMIGKIQWRGWSIPLMSYEAAYSGATPRFNADTKTIVMYSLSDDDKIPFIALVAQGLPERVSLMANDLEIETDAEVHELIESWVDIQETPAIIPNIDGMVEYVKQYT